MKKHKNLVCNNVIQGNDISRASYDLEVNEQHLVKMAIYKINDIYKILNTVQNLDKSIKLEDFKASFTTEEMCDLMGIDFNNRYTNSNYRKLLKSLLKKDCKLKKEDGTEYFSLLIYAKFNEKIQKIEMIFNPFFFKNIFDNEFYTKENLKIFGSLTKKASQRLFSFVSSSRNMVGRYGNEKNKWIVETTIEELRFLYRIPKDKITRTSHFMDRYVKQAVEEINKYNFEFSIDYETDGKPIRKITFTCTEKLKLRKITKNDTKEINYDKKNLNDEEKEKKYFKDTYADEWQQRMKDELNQKNFDFIEEEKDKIIFAESNVYAYFKKKYRKA